MIVLFAAIGGFVGSATTWLLINKNRLHRFKFRFDKFGNFVVTCKRCGKVWVS